MSDIKQDIKRPILLHASAFRGMAIGEFLDRYTYELGKMVDYIEYLVNKNEKLEERVQKLEDNK